MKNVKTMLVLATAIMAATACGPKKEAAATDNEEAKLVLYYSQTSNTKTVAREIATRLGADIEEIIPLKPYEGDLQATVERCRQEREEGITSEIQPLTSDLSQYDVIFLGYPVWFGTYAPPVKSFLEANNFLAGKKVVPFCTYGTGGRVSSVAKLAEVCPDAKIIDSYGLRGNRIDQAADEVSFFISGIAKCLLCDKKECCKEGEECCGEKKDECCGEKKEACCGEHQHADGEVCTDGCCDKEAWRELSAEDLAAFQAATAEFTRMPLEPVRVKNVALAGANRIYECTTKNREGETVTAQAYVLVPMGEGTPELTAVER